MKPVRIFRHIACEGPGYLGSLLDAQHIPYEIIAIDANEAIPGQLDDISGLVFMGGSMSVNDSFPWIEQELQLIRAARKLDLPMLGICLGSQLIAKALGGTVSKGNGMELGWAPVQKCHPVQQDGWFDELEDSFRVFHWHGEKFSLPEGTTLLLSSDCYPHQAFAIGNTLALQFHLEMTADMVVLHKMFKRTCPGMATRSCFASSDPLVALPIDMAALHSRRAGAGYRKTGQKPGQKAGQMRRLSC